MNRAFSAGTVMSHEVLGRCPQTVADCCAVGAKQPHDPQVLLPPDGDSADKISVRCQETQESEDCNTEPSFPLFPFVSLISVIRVIRIAEIYDRLRAAALADKVAFLWLNTELRGCRATALETM
jgi:hypothetical protein